MEHREPEKVIFVDGVRYIRSWKKMDRPKAKRPSRNRSEYMAAYRRRKRDETQKLADELNQLKKIIQGV